MKTVIFLISMTCILILNTNAQFVEEKQIQQDSDEWNWKEHINFGGGLGLSFGSATYVNVAPAVSIGITPKFTSGVKVSYIYYKNNDFDYSTTVYGGGVFSQYKIYNNIFAHCEYEHLNLDKYLEYHDPQRNISYYKKDGRIWVSSVFVGGGIRYPIGQRSFLSLMMLWNLNENRHSPYSNPVFRVNIFL